MPCMVLRFIVDKMHSLRGLSRKLHGELSKKDTKTPPTENLPDNGYKEAGDRLEKPRQSWHPFKAPKEQSLLIMLVLKRLNLHLFSTKDCTLIV